MQTRSAERLPRARCPCRGATDWLSSPLHGGFTRLPFDPVPQETAGRESPGTNRPHLSTSSTPIRSHALARMNSNALWTSSSATATVSVERRVTTRRLASFTVARLETPVANPNSSLRGAPGDRPQADIHAVQRNCCARAKQLVVVHADDQNVVRNASPGPRACVNHGCGDGSLNAMIPVGTLMWAI